MDEDESRIAEKYEAVRDVMDEQVRRLRAATEAQRGQLLDLALVHGGAPGR